MIKQSKKSVLIIDDEELVLDALSLVLMRNDFQVTSTNSAQHGLILCQENVYDVILTDIVMPDMDGVQFIEMLRNANCITPIITLTGGVRMGQKNMSRLAMLAGAQKSLNKPISKDELLSAIAQVISL